jgi:hypothetical protein
MFSGPPSIIDARTNKEAASRREVGCAETHWHLLALLRAPARGVTVMHANHDQCFVSFCPVMIANASAGE